MDRRQQHHGTPHRPKLTADEQVRLLAENGVRFDLFDEASAAEFLRSSTFFFKVKAFDKNFDKYSNPNAPGYGKYVNLDFAYLVDLSTLDMHLRKFVLAAALDLEHSLKVAINRTVMASGDDPYGMVSGFIERSRERTEREQRRLVARDWRAFAESAAKLEDAASRAASLGGPDPEGACAAAGEALRAATEMACGLDPDHVASSIARLGNSSYSRDLVGKYGDLASMAPWHFVEMASFGDVISFYKYLHLDGGFDVPPEEAARAKAVKGLLFPAKTLRNAAAHNDCLLNGMRKRLKGPYGLIAKRLVEEYGLPEDAVASTRHVPVVHDLSALLLAFDDAASSGGIRKARADDLADLSIRFGRNEGYYSSQQEVKQCVGVLRLLFDTFSSKYSE